MTWKAIPGYETMYEVSDTGQIRNWSTWRELKPRLCKKDGSFLVNLTNNGRKQTYPVHRLVALVHVPNPEEKKFVKHRDGDKSNNNASNLYWIHARKKIKGEVV
jgi:NUMOD4 motif/HNH endonuclease